MSQPAWIYARFSSHEQSKGHSLERQLENGRLHVERMGWEFSSERQIVDEGRSAFHGANRAEGSALHEFERKAREGAFADGAVLVVENLDRLTRQGYEEAIDLLRMLTANGVTVASWHDNVTYNAGERIDMMKVMSIILKAELALEESAKKSKRVRASWIAKIEAAQRGERTALTKILPAWLRPNDETRIMEVNEDRAKIVEEIYDWYCEGRGLPWMVNQLNTRSEPSWTYRKKGGSAGWSAPYLHKLLTNRAVLGEYAPASNAQAALHDLLKGIVIPDFFPQIIPTDKFNRVQVLRTQRAKWGGTGTRTMNNLFSGTARCGSCGGTMFYERKNRDANDNRSYLKCYNSRRNHGCTNKRSIRYGTLERWVLTALLSLTINDALNRRSPRHAALLTEVAERERQISLKEQQLANVTANLMEFTSKALAQKAAQLEGEIEVEEQALKLSRRELEREKGIAKPDEHMDHLQVVRDALTSSDVDERYGARVKTHQALKGLISKMLCHWDGLTEIVIGADVVSIGFDAEGALLGTMVLQEEIIGPDGERNWHPDSATNDAIPAD